MGRKVIMIFIDGLGVPLDNLNKDINPLINSFNILNYSHIMDNGKDFFSFCGLDAIMHVPGLPQSATGQASIYTGLNTQKILNEHILAYPTKKLAKIILENSLFLKLKKINKTTVFLNAYTDSFFSTLKNDFGIDSDDYDLNIDGFTERLSFNHRFSATTLQNLSARNPFYHIDDIKKGRSIFHDIDGWVLVKHNILNNMLPESLIMDAFFYNLDKFDLILFEYFLTDIYGHKQSLKNALQSLLSLDRLLSLLIDNVGQNTSIIIVSDHGNVEDLSVSTHTNNKAIFGYSNRSDYCGPLPKDLSEVSDYVIRLLAC